MLGELGGITCSRSSNALPLNVSPEEMESGLEAHLGLDPHVETSREELELGLAPSKNYNVQDSGDKIANRRVNGTGNPEILSAGINGSVISLGLSQKSPPGAQLQQAEVVPVADEPKAVPNETQCPQIPVNCASLTDIDGENDQLLTSRSGSVDRVLAALTGESSDTTASVVSVSEDHSMDEDCADDERSRPEEAANELRGDNQGSSLKRCAVPTTFSDLFQSVVEAESSSPQKDKRDFPAAASGSLLSPVVEISSLPNGLLGTSSTVPRVNEDGVLHAGNTSTKLMVDYLNDPGPRFEAAAVLHMENTSEPKSYEGRKADLGVAPIGVRPASGPSAANLQDAMLTATSALAQSQQALRRCQGPSQVVHREARLASVATTVSAAASVAKSAVEAAEASIEALTHFGVHQGSPHQAPVEGRSRRSNPGFAIGQERTPPAIPQPLQVASGSRAVAAGGKRTIQTSSTPYTRKRAAENLSSGKGGRTRMKDQRLQIVENTGGKETYNTLDLIKKGATVEVMLKEEGLQGGWFFAKVIRMKVKEALVVYEELMADDGCSQLEEWFPLFCSREEDAFGNTMPGEQGWIRPVHPFSSAVKRGRYSMDSEGWVVGNHIDAFVQDGWWEGIIEDLDEHDETKITVYFPGDGSTMVVKSWNVRPSLIWEDGEWRAWSHDPLEEDDRPSKRQRTGKLVEKVQMNGSKQKGTPDKTTLRDQEETPKPLAVRTTRQTLGVKNSGNEGVVPYTGKVNSKEPSVTPVRELRSGSRPLMNSAQKDVLANSSKTPNSKKPGDKFSSRNMKDALKGSPPSTRTRQKEASMMVPPKGKLSKEVRFLLPSMETETPKGKAPSTRSQQKESHTPIYTPRGAPSIRSQQRGEPQTPIDTPRGAPSTRSQQKGVPQIPHTMKEKISMLNLQKNEVPEARTRSRRFAASKR